LVERILAEQAARETQAVQKGERKIITALVEIIHELTAWLETFDPEEASRMIDPALQLMIDAVQHDEGAVAQLTREDLLALLGVPTPHEDHPHGPSMLPCMPKD